MTACPCCSNSMIRHIRHHQIHWFCRSCWQEMPVFPGNLSAVSAALEQHFISQIGNPVLTHV